MIKYILGALFLLKFSSANKFSFKNNACSTYSGYLFRFASPDCHYNDEHSMNIPQLLEKRKIRYENHTVTTEDGYILSLFRVLHHKPKGVIVFFHPMTQDGRVWFTGKNDSYVHNFHSAGYELWLPNFRGLEFSDKHIQNLDVLEYWDFGLTEMGRYDCSAIINYVHNVTSTKIIVLAHSMGGTNAVIYASLKPKETEEKVKIFVIMGAAIYMKNCCASVKPIIPLIPMIKIMMEKNRYGAIFTRVHGVLTIVKKFHLTFPTTILRKFSSVTNDSYLARPDLAAEILSNTPQPLSMKIIYQFIQFISTGRFGEYDYGVNKNIQLYKSPTPPEFQVKNISVPFYIIYGSKDEFGDKKGNELFFSKLPDKAKIYGKLEIQHYEHADFLWAKDFTDLQKNIMHLLEKL